MPATYEPIASVTLTSAASSISFTGIAATYTDIVASIVAIPDSDIDIGFRVNNDSGANYSATAVLGNGSIAASRRNSSLTWGYASINSGSVSVADGDRIVTSLWFMSYANTNVFKTVLHASGVASRGVQRSVSLWRSTSAINRIDIVAPSGGNLKSGSIVSLYGIKAA